MLDNLISALFGTTIPIDKSHILVLLAIKYIPEIMYEILIFTI